jgi:hypothetical protein
LRKLSFAQIEGKYYCCRKAGHMFPQYKLKDKPRAKWAINKYQQTHIQTGKKGKNSEFKSANLTPSEQDNKNNINSLDGQFTSNFIKRKK